MPANSVVVDLSRASRVQSTDHVPPAHLVNPTTGQRAKFDAKGEAVCPICGAVWWRCERFIMLVTGEDRRSTDSQALGPIKRNRLERRDSAALRSRNKIGLL